MASITLVFVLAMAALAAARAQNKYTDRYDNVDVKQIVDNRRLLLPYVKCVLDQGKCSAEGKELKSHIKEALENYCAKCTESQRRGTRVVLAHLINKEPQLWEQLSAKYDADRKYVTKYEDELRTIKA